MTDGDRTHPPRVRRRADLSAWRVWRVVRRGDGLVLRSPVYDDEWRPGEPLAAACHSDAAHAAPHLACGCGIYGVREPEGLRRYLVGRDGPEVVCRLAGEVTLWGAVLEGEAGWRAASAYPRRLVVRGPAALAMELAAGLSAYRVPLEHQAEDTSNTLLLVDGGRWRVRESGK